MIKFVSGDFFEFDADIMINTVNCVGVMGTGVALAFKKRYPEMFSDYARKCKAGEIRPGHPSVWIQNDIISKPLEVINFPTKNDWRKPSEYSYIEDGLAWLSDYLKGKKNKKVTVPALGCGHGGLSWEKVKPIILKHLENSPAEIFVFEPSDSVNAGISLKKDQNYSAILDSAGVEVIKPTSKKYPEKLKTYTNKDLFVYPKNKPIFLFDFALVCSTKPTSEEIDLIEEFVKLCSLHKKSILFGSSALERKISFYLSELGTPNGCMLSSGISESAKKLKEKESVNEFRLLSIGDPLGKFNKNDFLPAVLGRIHLSHKTIFLTSNMAWTSKFKSIFRDNSIDSHYYKWPQMYDPDLQAAIAIGAKNIDLQDLF